MESVTKHNTDSINPHPGEHRSPTAKKPTGSQWGAGIAKDIVIRILRGMQSSHGRLILESPSLGTITIPAAGENKHVAEATVRVHDEEFFLRCLLFADIGLAESYIDGLCDLNSIRSVISWFLSTGGDSLVLNESKNATRAVNLLSGLNRAFHSGRKNTLKNSRKNISDHYDLGNDFFASFLDSSMTYSSGIFSERSQSLESAQRAKFERIADKLKLTASDSLLEIGCGWGGFSRYAVENFGCKVTAVTISQQQFDHCRHMIASRGLEKYIDLQLRDYRKIEGKFDKIVSIEMIEAVGDEFIDAYVGCLDKLLKPQGLILLQMITCPDSMYNTLKANVDFIQKHIFPGSLLPSLRRLDEGFQKTGSSLFLVDLFDMTSSYVRTLELWQENFNSEIDNLSHYNFDQRFIRKWNYYFEYCQAAFDMRNISVVQSLYSRPKNQLLRGQV